MLERLVNCTALLDMPEKLVGEMLSASQEKKQTRLHDIEVIRT
jgi:hypothetical protein